MRCRKLFKKAISLVIIAAVCIGGFGAFKPTVSARAESISEMKSRVSGLESQKSSLQSKIDSLQNDIDKKQEYLDTINSYISTVESKIMTCESILASYQSEIDELNRDIEKKEEELKANKELFQRRIRSIYMSGNNNSLLFLMGSDEYANYLSMSEFTESLAKYDNALMTKINNAMDDINKSIEEKNKAKKEQEAVKEELATERANLASKQQEASAAVSSVQKSKADLQKELQQVESSISSLESSIDKAYEAARRAAEQAQQSGGGSLGNYSGKGFAWPLPGYTMITSPFGFRYDPYYLCYRGHNGIDISGGGVAGKPIIASASGTVTVAEFNNGGYGNYVVISHGFMNGSLVTTHYGHMMSYAVSVGQSVKQGDIIGYVGTTGASTGYHLHFEVRLNNSPVNPFGYVSY